MLNEVFIIHMRSPVNSMVGGCRVLAHGEQQWEPALPAGGVQAKRLNPAGATRFGRGSGNSGLLQHLPGSILLETVQTHQVIYSE